VSTYYRTIGHRRGLPTSGIAFIMLAFVVLAAAGITFSIINATHVEHRTCTVNDKDRTTVSDSDGNNKSDMRVYTDQCGVLHVADSLLSWTWHSSDTYASMKTGHTYRVTTRGFRVPFLSMFPNVVEAAEVAR
jgi:hypothetical protein